MGRGGFLADPRLTRGDRAQGIRLLRRLQRTHGNAVIARALSARHRPSLSVQAAVIDIPPPPTRDAVEPPESDPRFERATVKTARTARRERKHLPAKAKAAEAQKAAVPPANDASSQAAAAQVGKMDAQKPGEFDKKAFIAAVEKAVTAATPGSLKEATEFKESGKAAQVKGQVSGMVSQDKQKAEKGIKDKTKEPPDTSVAVAKPVTPMPTEQPGGAPGSIGAAAAMPEKRPATETDLRSGPAEVDNEMAEAEVSETQLREANEPEFDQAVDSKKEAEVHSATAPAAYRAEEAATLGAAKAEAAGTERKQLAGMHLKRTGVLGRVQAGKATTKSQDEIKRAEVATKIDGIFAKTKTEVTTILDGIEAKMTPIFEGGEKSARATFESLVSQRMRAYKKKRYSGIRGKARWVRDKFRSLPSVVNKFYEEGKAVYIGLMTKVIGRVADLVGGELTRAKTRIAQGRAEVKTYVDGLPKNLKKVGLEAQEKIGDQFDSLDSDVADKQGELVTSLADKYKEARGALDERIEALQEENKGLIDKAIDAVKGVIKTIMKLKDMLLGVLARAVNAIGSIIAHPIRFLGNFVSAVKSGVMLFKDNILTHLAKGLMGWLFGEMAKTGIELPKTFDLKGILGLILQILGLTWANIRARAVAIVGEKVVGRMEQGVEVFKVLIAEGPAGLWGFIKDKVGDLKEAIIGPMKDFVLTKVIVAGVTWLISLMNPASAFIKACKAIYDIVMFFVERAAQIKAFVDSVLDSIEAIAAGGAGGVAKLIEDSLAKMVPVVISFLAALLGVSGIGEKIRSVIGAIQKPVNRAIDAVLKGALKLGKKLFGGAKALFSKGKAWVKGKVEAGKKWLSSKAAKGKEYLKKKLGMSEESAGDVVKGEARNRLLAASGSITTVEELRARVAQIATDLKPRGLKLFEVVESKEPGVFDVMAEASRRRREARAKTRDEQAAVTVHATLTFASPPKMKEHFGSMVAKDEEGRPVMKDGQFVMVPTPAGIPDVAGHRRPTGRGAESCCHRSQARTS